MGSVIPALLDTANYNNACNLINNKKKTQASFGYHFIMLIINGLFRLTVKVEKCLKTSSLTVRL